MAMVLADRFSDIQLAGQVKNGARQAWLAGLGAVCKVRNEGGRVFETLVERGEQVQAQARKRAEDKVDAVRGRVENLRDRASDNWSKLEQVFQDRVARALNRLGVPTPADVQALAKQVEALQASIQDLVRAEDAEARPVRAKARKPEPA